LGAHSAYAALTQSQSRPSSGPLAQAIGQIGDALQSGDLGKAQQALASLQQQTQSARGAHHHHGGHHHASGGEPATSVVATTDPTASPASTSLVDVTA
jgi:hypothetical protein